MRIAFMQVLVQRCETPKKGKPLSDRYLEILSYIFEFKLATACHLSRFVRHMEYDEHLAAALSVMWRGGYLVRTMAQAGNPVRRHAFYLLARDGLAELRDAGLHPMEHLERYPRAEPFLASANLRHEVAITELSSMESLIAEPGLSLDFSGELSSLGHERKSGYAVEVFTPDYVVRYAAGNKEYPVYTEYERTRKSPEVLVKKMEHYAYRLQRDERGAAVVRCIFETADMEGVFWSALLARMPQLLGQLRVMTTNLGLIEESRDFLMPIYASGTNVRLGDDRRAHIDPAARAKLFPFL